MDLTHIDWHGLTCAYGPADAVPVFLRDIRASDQAARHAALDGLFSHVWHQGSVYEVTAVAVPFIAEAAFGSGEDRADLFELLRLIRAGQSDARQHASLDSAEVRASAEWQARVVREDGWVEAAHRAVDNMLPAVLNFLCDTSQPELVRWQAAWLAYAFWPDTPGVVAEVARSGTPFMQAGLVLLGADLAATAPIIAIATSIVAARQALDEQEVDRALGLLHACEPVHPAWNRLPGAHARGPAMQLLMPVVQAGPRFAGRAIPALIAMLPALTGSAVDVAASALLFLSFRAGATVDAATIAAAVRAVANADALWERSQTGMLESYGLPLTRDELRAHADTFV
jgi:hypothetical protein